MPYSHSEGGANLDSRLEDFFTYLPFEINPQNRQITLCPGTEKAYAALMSIRRSDADQRTPPTNDNNQRSHVLALDANNTITINNARLVRSLRHKRSGDRLMLDLFEMQTAAPVNWFDLAAWSPGFEAPAHMEGHAVWAQTISMDEAEIPYAWDIFNVHSAGGRSSESVGLVVPLLQGGFTQMIMGKCTGVNPGAAGQAMPPITINSDGPKSLFAEDVKGAGGVCKGFVAIAAGSFAPVDSRRFNYDVLSRFGAMTAAQIVEALEQWVFPNWQQRREILLNNPAARLPGQGIPVEVVYFQQLANAATPEVLA